MENAHTSPVLQKLNETPRPFVRAHDAALHGASAVNPNPVIRQAKDVRNFRDILLPCYLQKGSM